MLNSLSESLQEKISQDRHQKLNSRITYLFGETIQITYKVENITSSSFTLLYDSDDESLPFDRNFPQKKKCVTNGQKQNCVATFKQMAKISRRIMIWCYPFDLHNPTEPNPPGGGFPRGITIINQIALFPK